MFVTASAQEAFQLDEIILSGSLSPVAAGKTGATVEVLDSNDLTGRDTSVIQRLDRLAGVSSIANGGVGTETTLQLRGLPSEYVVVRVNGIEMNDPSKAQSSFNFGSFTPSGIDRIEVLKGSQSALYGSEAIGGVIDITTYRPTKLGFSSRVSSEFGSYGTASGTLALGMVTDRAEIALTYGRIVSEGFSARTNNEEDDSFNQTTVTFTGRYKVTDTLTVGAAVNSRDGTSEFDGFSEPSGQNFFDELGVRVFGELEIGNVAHTLAYSYLDVERISVSRNVADLFQGERKRLSYLGSASLANGYTLNFGIDRIKESFFSAGTTGDQDTTSAKAELLFQPSQTIDASATLRYDDTSTFGGKATGRLAGVWRPQEDLSFRAVVGTGFRAPSLFERLSRFGVPGLRPEDSRSFELGVEKTYGTLASVKATLFYTEIDNLIDFDGTSTVCGSGRGCYNQVPGTTRSRGLELSGEYAFNDATRITANYTFTDASTNGERLTRTPRNDLAIALDTDLTDRLHASFDVRYVGDVLPRTSADVTLGDYTVVGAGFFFDVTDTAQAYLRIENLFDEDYETIGGYNTPGRSAFLGIRANF